jgi:phosphonate transport system substrate-binding protein
MTAAQTFAYDGNFRFDVKDPPWARLFDSHGITPVRYDDMAELTDALTSSVQTISYLPAANYFYLRDNPRYEPVASAIYAAEDSTLLRSVLVVRSESAVTELDQLRGASLGYAHRFCTTSYFAPAILVHEHASSLDEFFGELTVVAPYEGQVDAVVAGMVDATMVQEDVWRKHPEYARTTRVIAREGDLPTPVVIVDSGADAALKSDLNDVLLAHRPRRTPDTLFAGFVPFEHERVERFFAAAADAVPALDGISGTPA